MAMTLVEYIRKHGRAKLARALKTSEAYISQLAHGHRRVTEGKAMLIERATRGAVRCEDLRPDVDWSVLRRPAAHGASSADSDEAAA